MAARRRDPPADCPPKVLYDVGSEWGRGCRGARGEREYALGRAGRAWASKELEEGLLTELWATLVLTHCPSIR